MTYIPFKGGGEVAVQLVGGHVDSTVNNPIEAVAQWRAGKLRPLCVFDAKPMPYPDKIAGDVAWGDIPTCKSQGLDLEYLMLRGIFMPPGATQEQVDYYVDLLKKVRETPEWKQLMHDGAFDTTFMAGAGYAKWVGNRGTAPSRPDEGRGLPRRRKLKAALRVRRRVRPAGEIVGAHRRQSWTKDMPRALGRP